VSRAAISAAIRAAASRAGPRTSVNSNTSLMKGWAVASAASACSKVVVPAPAGPLMRTHAAPRAKCSQTWTAAPERITRGGGRRLRSARRGAIRVAGRLAGMSMNAPCGPPIATRTMPTSMVESSDGSWGNFAGSRMTIKALATPRRYDHSFRRRLLESKYLRRTPRLGGDPCRAAVFPL
jgi:hypothetical protein